MGIPSPTFNTTERIIRQAMREAGLLKRGQDPSSEDFADNLLTLKNLINYLSTKGLKLWCHEDLKLTLTAGTGLYTPTMTLSSGTYPPLRVVEAYYLYPSGVRRPLIPLAWDDWVRLSQVSMEGTVTQYFVDKQIDSLNVHLWMIPNTLEASGTVHLIVQRPLDAQDSLDDKVDFPPEWILALTWGLANEICTGQSQETIARCASMAKFYRTELENWDVENAPVKFSPSGRGDHGHDFY